MKKITLDGDPADWAANLNMRNWVQAALEAKGAIFSGAGVCAESSDLDIAFEGVQYNIRIRALKDHK